MLHFDRRCPFEALEDPLGVRAEMSRLSSDLQDPMRSVGDGAPSLRHILSDSPVPIAGDTQHFQHFDLQEILTQIALPPSSTQLWYAL